MGAFNPRMKFGMTLGTDKQSAYLMLSDYIRDYKVTKSELLSIFNNETDKKTAEQIFNIWNTSQNTNDSEEHIDAKELSSMGFSVLHMASEDDNTTNLSDEEVLKFYKDKGINGSSSVLMQMVHYLGTKDVASCIESGDFNINGRKISMRAEQLNNIDASGKTYKLTNNLGIIKSIINKINGDIEEYIAEFKGKNPELKSLTSRIYAKFLGSPELEVTPISAPNGAQGTVKSANSQVKEFDKNKKLALDILLGNIASKENITFDNAFDTDENGIKKAFSFIPDEIEDLIKNNNYSKKDLIKALNIIAELKDEDIDEMLDNQEAKYEYKNVLIKRRDFCKNLLNELSNTSKSAHLEKIFNTAKINVIENSITQISDIKDINTYERVIRNISDNNIKERLSQKLNTKKAELNSQIKPEYVKELSKEEFNEQLSRFGFIVVNDIDKIEEKYVGLSKEKLSEYPQETASQLSFINYNKLLECINLRAKAGINVLKDEETFIKFIRAEDRFHGFDDKPHEYDFNTYMTIIDAFSIPMSEANQNGVNWYKNDNSYIYFHEMYQANNESNMQIIKNLDDALGLTQVSQFLNKASTPCDTEVYRGQSFDIFEKTTLPNGTNLAERMKEAVKALPDETEISNVINEFKQIETLSINEPKFVSTSVSQDVAKSFAKRKEGILMNITIPAGSKATCLDALIQNGYDESEEEILVQRGSNYIIKSISYDKDAGYWIVNCSIETK